MERRRMISWRMAALGAKPAMNCTSWRSICSAGMIGWSQERLARRVAQ
ncbi:MAG TPA: hypothetical protein VMG62_00780 [Solirubrobacteraceae bacterium]|nr:hypothetical protein [Solirubrobacteraceae bacterium]